MMMMMMMMITMMMIVVMVMMMMMMMMMMNRCKFALLPAVFISSFSANKPFKLNPTTAILQIREDIEMANLARIYLKEMIKRECWDAMVVKGRSCKAFRSTMSVTNYPMRERTKDELEEL